MHPDIDHIHSRALELSAAYRRTEAELIEVLVEAEKHRVFLTRGHPSLFAYVVKELGLAENAAYTLITVARKSREVPALQEALKAGEITLSNARRVASVLTSENQEEWIPKAATLPTRKLERAIAAVRPQEATPERASYLTSGRVKLEVGLSERAMLRFRRAQDLVCQSKGRPVRLEETLEVMTDEFLRRHDPLQKAKRHRIRKVANEEARTESRSMQIGELGTGREPIPAAILHQVNLRDERRCTYMGPDGSRCNQARWVQLHHIQPVSQGGRNTPSNLTTLCTAHHQLLHLQEGQYQQRCPP